MDDTTIENEADKVRLKAEIAELKRDLAAITQTLADKGVQLLDDFSDDDDDDETSTLDDLRERGRRAAIGLGHKARQIADTPTQNSVSTLMIIAGLGVIIGMLAR
ncbi:MULTISPECIES: hypothetical protein [unclassified Phyllobacterium]|jgi:hypothetical protein|uniref:hypothetical protein n=1 Tax=Phyllobacterium TaxID=28100 RepID=UPI0004860E1D|nr:MULTISPECIES: hypothetical protein [unclassified Phyllobacterium]UGY08262.1 hypothetical protein LLE51_009290 [Phyllobacterium sp. T1018]